MGVIDAEPYDDGSAGIALVVAPACRGQGIGRRLLRALDDQAELARVQWFVGAVEPENAAARAAVGAAGFRVAGEPDAEGMLRIERRRGA